MKNFLLLLGALGVLAVAPAVRSADGDLHGSSDWMGTHLFPQTSAAGARTILGVGSAAIAATYTPTNDTTWFDSKGAAAAAVATYTPTNDTTWFDSKGAAAAAVATYTPTNNTTWFDSKGAAASLAQTNTYPFNGDTNELVTGHWYSIRAQRALLVADVYPATAAGALLYSNAVTGQQRTFYLAEGVTNFISGFPLQPSSQFAISNAVVLPNSSSLNY